MSDDPLDPTVTPEAPPAVAPPPAPAVPLPPGYTYVPVRRDPKSPAAAVILSFFPGLGQVYNGQISKALAFFCVWLGSFYVMVEGNPIPWVFVMVFTHMFAFIDAYRSAVLINARAAGGAAEESTDDLPDSPVWGGVLVLLGLLLLLGNLGWLRLTDLQRFWPVLLIIAGATTLWNSLKQRRARETRDETAAQD